MAPHRALENHDVVYQILQHFGPSAYSNRTTLSTANLRVNRGKQQKALAYCARTSKAFSEPATRLLWRELPSLIPLLSVALSLDHGRTFMSYHTNDSDPDSEDDLNVNQDEDKRLVGVIQRKWFTTGIPTQEGLRRLHQFAAFVRRISLPPNEEIDPTVFFYLSQHPGKPLLPMVDEVKCTVSPYLDCIVFSLAGPSLRKLVVLQDVYDTTLWDRSTDRATCTVGRLLCALPSRAPGLQSLCIRDKTCHLDLLPHIVSIGHMRDLRQLQVMLVSRGPWLGPLTSALVKLDNLRDLALPLDSVFTETEPTLPAGFPSLRTLRLSGKKFTDTSCLDVLAGMVPSIGQLERLDIIKYSLDERCNALDAFTSLCADTLTTVRLYTTQANNRDPIPAISLLQALTKLRRLQFCTIVLSGRSSLTNEDLCKTHGAWLHLEKFTLTWSGENEAHAVPTFHGVIDFIFECPRLSVLKLPAVNIGGRTAQRCDYVRTLQSHVKTRVKDKRIRDSVALANVLRILFPRIRVSQDAVDRGRDKWRVVLSTLKNSFVLIK